MATPKTGVALLLGKLEKGPPAGKPAGGSFTKTKDSANTKPAAADSAGGALAGDELKAALDAGDGQGIYDALCSIIDMHNHGEPDADDDPAFDE